MINEAYTQPFGDVFSDLLAQPRTMPLGPGSPEAAVEEKLRRLTVERAFAGQPVADEQMAEAAIAGVWLYHDFLDESHRISQGIHTPTGSYWHGIMHRREPDYPNAKHWFRKTGDHPVYGPLHVDAAELARNSRDSRAARLQQQSAWDAAAFVDLCEQATAETNGTLQDLCLKIQMREWWLLFEYCYRHAIGRAAD